MNILLYHHIIYKLKHVYMYKSKSKHGSIINACTSFYDINLDVLDLAFIFFLFFANICFSKFETIVFEKIISIAACELEELSSTRSIYEHIALPSYYIHGMAFGIKRPYQWYVTLQFSWCIICCFVHFYFFLGKCHLTCAHDIQTENRLIKPQVYISFIELQC